MDESRRLLLLQRFAEAMAQCEQLPTPEDVARARSICATPAEPPNGIQAQLPLPIPQ